MYFFTILYNGFLLEKAPTVNVLWEIKYPVALYKTHTFLAFNTVASIFSSTADIVIYTISCSITFCLIKSVVNIILSEAFSQALQLSKCQLIFDIYQIGTWFFPKSIYACVPSAIQMTHISFKAPLDTQFLHSSDRCDLK